MTFEIQGNKPIEYLNNLKNGARVSQSEVSEPLLRMSNGVSSDGLYESMGVSFSHDPTFRGMETAAPEFRRFSGKFGLSNPVEASETLGSYARLAKHFAKAPEVEQHLRFSPYQFD